MQRAGGDEEGHTPQRLEMSAFEDLVVLYDRKLYNLVLRLVKHPDDAADLTQETFVRAFKSWDKFEGRSSPYTWLCQIAINLYRNRARDRASWSLEPMETDDLVSPIPTPEAALHNAVFSDTIRRAIDSLPGEYRIVSVLRDLQGLTYQEIAEAADLSVDVVKTRLARARSLLRKKLQNFL